MKNRLSILGLVLILSTLIVSGCGPAAVEPAESPTSEPRPVVHSVELREGDTYEIALETDPTSGNEWEVEFSEASIEVVDRTSDDAAGKEIFTLRARAVGVTEVYFSYGRRHEVIYNFTIGADPALADAMSEAEAREIAASSECGEAGALKETAFYNDWTATWWIDLDVEQKGCNPACVVDVRTGWAEINWRCTGALPPEDTGQSTPTAEPSAPTLAPSVPAPPPLAESTTEPVMDWVGTVVKLPPGNQFGHYFERDDGQRFDIGSTDEAITRQIAEVRWTGAQVRVWGKLFTGVPAVEARHIEVERIEVISGPAEEGRNLSPFAVPSASSTLPADRGGTYHAYSAIDGLLESAWVEGATGPGIGEWMMLTFPEAIVVDRIGLDVGFDRDADIFAKNNRLKRATIRFSNGEQIELAFSDIRGVQMVDIAPVETTFVQVVVDEIYPGTRYDDTCLAEIEVWGRTR